MGLDKTHNTECAVSKKKAKNVEWGEGEGTKEINLPSTQQSTNKKIRINKKHIRRGQQ